MSSARDMYRKLSRVPLTPLMAVTVMVLSLFITSNLATKRQSTNTGAAPAGGDLFFASQELNLEPNSTGVYDIYVTSRNGYEISAVDLSVSIDSTVVEISGVELVGAFPIEFEIDYSDSTAHIVAGVDPSSPFSGTGLVARLNLTTGNQVGSATISFDSSTELAAVGVNENSLGTISSSTVLVGSAATATPTKSPWSTSTPTPTSAQSSTPTPTIDLGFGGECTGRCVGPNTTCDNVDASAQCPSGRICCIDNQ